MRLRCLCLSVLLPLASAAAAAPPVVSNVTASQRTDGSKKVDIRYNLADPDSATLTVSVRISGDGGATWTVPVSQLTGDVGSGVPRGTGRQLGLTHGGSTTRAKAFEGPWSYLLL